MVRPPCPIEAASHSPHTDLGHGRKSLLLFRAGRLSLGFLCRFTQFMIRSMNVIKKKLGRPPTGTGIQVGERWHDAELTAIDKWIASNGKITRGQAIRQLVALGLKAKAK